MEIFLGINGRFSIESTKTFYGVDGIFPYNLQKHSMELTAYFHRIYGIVPWNPLNFHEINGKNLWHFMNFHNFLLLVYLPSTAMETLKTPSEYSVDFNRGFQGFSMANLEKGLKPHIICFGCSKEWFQ